MAKFSQIKIPVIIVMEGFWGTGKSTMIAKARQSYPLLFIPEPNYISSKIKSGISKWYRHEHNKRMRLAEKYIQYGRSAILERSILSSAAFHYARYKTIPFWFSSTTKKLQSLSNLYVFFFYEGKKDFLRKVADIQDRTVRTAIVKQKNFYERYLDFFEKIVPKIIGPRVRCVKISNGSSINLNRKIKELLKDGKVNIKRKLKEVKLYCASAVIFYKDKLLLLYSNKHRHFSFPQGHRRPNEKFSQTILREIREETGFYDLKIITPISTYGYRFFDKGIIKHKVIKCFLVKLRSLKKRSKRLERHESYTNYFFTAQDALNKLKWAEDKELLKQAQEKLPIKKSHS